MSNTIQYTVRAVPTKLDQFLRQQARLHGKSLNKTILDYIQQASKLDMQTTEDNFDWIIGANTLDNDSLRAISELKQADKLKSHMWSMFLTQRHTVNFCVATKP